MSEVPTIPVIIIQVSDEPMGFTHRYTGSMFTAYVASNPRLSSNGISEDDALARLQAVILKQINSNRLSVKMVNMVLTDLISEEVHKS
jgi:hypothetical protein